jgi:guanylate cyclase
MGGTIQITRETYELIHDQFICELRGSLDIKGKGKMEVWLVVAEKEKIPSGGDDSNGTG